MRRFIAALIAVCIWASPAFAALTIDGTPQTGLISGAATNTVASAAFTSSNSNDVVIAFVNTTNGSSITVSSISGGGLTWIKRKQFAITTSTFNFGSIEEWYGIAASPLSSQVITATLSGNSNSATITVFAISGGNTTTPFDVNVSLPATASDITGTSTVPTVSGVSTTNANTVLLSLVCLPGNNVTLTDPSGFTRIGLVSGFSGSPNFTNGSSQSDRNIVSLSQSSISVAYSTVANWGMLVDAVQAAGAAATLPPQRASTGVGK